MRNWEEFITLTSKAKGCLFAYILMLNGNMSHEDSSTVRFDNVDLAKIAQSKREFEKENGHHYVEKIIQDSF